MINVSRVLIITSIVFTLGIAGSFANAAPGKSNGVGGWEPSADQVENIVISIKTDPTVGENIDEIREAAEPACVALQIGINLLKDMVKVGDNNIPVTPADRVTLFTTVGGVQLVNPDEEKQAILDDETVCFAPDDGVLFQSLNQLLGKFSSNGGEIVVCPLCAITRGIMPAPPATMANAEDIHNLFLYADKVIDF
jgi:hypothetical protein